MSIRLLTISFGLLFLQAYVIAYVVLLDPEELVFSPLQGKGEAFVILIRTPSYRGDWAHSGLAERVFRPLVLIDQGVRPAYWAHVVPVRKLFKSRK